MPVAAGSLPVLLAGEPAAPHETDAITRPARHCRLARFFTRGGLYAHVCIKYTREPPSCQVAQLTLDLAGDIFGRDD